MWVPMAAMNPRATEKGITGRDLSKNPNNKKMLCSKSVKMDSKSEKFLNEHFRKSCFFHLPSVTISEKVKNGD